MTPSEEHQPLRLLALRAIVDLADFTVGRFLRRSEPTREWATLAFHTADVADWTIGLHVGFRKQRPS
jgi:hypothetical protein